MEFYIGRLTPIIIPVLFQGQCPHGALVFLTHKGIDITSLLEFWLQRLDLGQPILISILTRIGTEQLHIGGFVARILIKRNLVRPIGLNQHQHPRSQVTANGIPMERIIGIHGIKVFLDREKFHFPTGIFRTGTKENKDYVKKRKNARGIGFFRP